MNRDIRKKNQQQNEVQYREYKKELKEKIKMIEEYDIKDKMKNDIRDWINTYKYENKGEPPRHLGLFYDRFKVEKRVELDENQKKVAENLAKLKLKQEQDKKKKDENGPVIDRYKLKSATFQRSH